MSCSHPPFSLGIGAAAFSLRSTQQGGGQQQKLREKLFSRNKTCFESVNYSDRSTSDLIFCPIVCLSMSFCLFCQFCLTFNPSINLLKSQSFSQSDFLSCRLSVSECRSANYQSVSQLEAGHSVSPTLSYCLVSMSFCLLALSNSVCM